MNPQLAKIWQLQMADNEMGVSEKQLAELDDGSSLKKEVELWRPERESCAEKLEKKRIDWRDAELRLQSVEEKKADCEKQLYGAYTTNPRELEDLQEELTALSELKDKLETTVLEFMEEAEKLEAELKEREAKISSAEKELAETEKNYAQESQRLTSRLEELKAERESLVKSLDAGLVARYETIRKRKGGIGAALLERDACSECHMTVATLVVRQIREGNAIMTCESCGRLLCPKA